MDQTNQEQATHTPGGTTMLTGIPELKVKIEWPLWYDAFERVDAMDMSEEEPEDVMGNQPSHVRKWLRDLPTDGQRCSFPDPLAPSASEVNLASTSGMAKVCETNSNHSESILKVTFADVCWSTSGVTATSRPSDRRKVSEGSECDSDFDDAFDLTPVAPAPIVGLEREIPDNDDLEEPLRRIIVALENAMDDEADRLPGVSISYDWKEDFESFRGVPETFSGPTPGPVKDYDTPYEAFTDIWSEDFIECIVQETNRYAKQTIEANKANGTLTPSSRLHQWTDTNADEIMVLLAVFMYMGIDVRTYQYEYWKTDDYLDMPKFRQLMSYNRYILLSKFLHFVDNSDVSRDWLPIGEVELSPKLAKLKPVISHLNEKFSSLYNLKREISIDESLTLFKGRLSWAQTIRTKAARFGIKSYELCESQTGYMYKFYIHTGKDSGDVSSVDVIAPSVDLGGKSTKVVLDLLKDLKHLGHCVTMDNFYNCPALARYLKSLGIDCLGTLRTNRRNVPLEIAKAPTNVKTGTIIARHCGDVSVLAWKDSRLVTMISTYHTDETFVVSKGNKVIVKPKSVRDYNDAMGGVVLKDQKLSMYLLERKRGLKWYVKMFKRLLNTSIHNAFIMLTMSLRRRGKLPMTHREFRYGLAKSLVDRHRLAQPEISMPEREVMRLRKDIVHEPSYIAGGSNRKRCVVCTKQGKEKKIHSQCVTCKEFLCFKNCWKEWHSLANLKSKESRGRKRRRDDN